MKKIKIAIVSFVVLFFVSNSFAQKRFQSPIFSSIDSITNIEYGQAVNIKGKEEKLLLDVFMPPKTDSLKRRPLLIFIHGGGFQSNTKTGQFSSLVCNGFAMKGYVTASIDYRLGVEQPKTNKEYAEAMYRAQQDGKAAIRFFRKNADLYGIDESQIFITGSSAGSKTCLAIAYMNENEVPKEVDTNKWGSLEGNSGNPGYSSKVSGVMNCWGALIDYKWIQSGEAPLFNTAGTEDKTVPYDSSYDYHGFKYGPYILFQHCAAVGIPTGWRPFYGAGHTLNSKKIKFDSCIQSMSDWLYTQLKIVKKNGDKGVWRYEDDIRKFDSLNKVEKYSEDAILVLGSSYIRLWKNIRKDLDYKEIIHRGFGGSNLADVAYYIKRIVFPHQPKALFMYVGNDITASEKDKTPDQVFEYFKFIVQTLREKYPTMPITWLAISPSEKRWSKWDKVCEANTLIKSYCESEKNIYYINSGDKFLGEDGLPITKYYKDDKLHYNEEGYKVWGDNIRKQVKKIAKKG